VCDIFGLLQPPQPGQALVHESSHQKEEEESLSEGLGCVHSYSRTRIICSHTHSCAHSRITHARTQSSVSYSHVSSHSLTTEESFKLPLVAFNDFTCTLTLAHTPKPECVFSQTSHSLMITGPKSFTLERLLMIFNAILPEDEEKAYGVCACLLCVFALCVLVVCV